MYEPPPNSEIVRVLELLNVDGDRLVDWEAFKKLVEETMPNFGPGEEQCLTLVQVTSWLKSRRIIIIIFIQSFIGGKKIYLQQYIYRNN